jgi:hypothetical protein
VRNRSGEDTSSGAGTRRWPLLFIALSASAAIWSGWVALGELCGFGPVNLLPGIAGGFTLNTAITLPVGAEAYAAFAIGAWISPRTPQKTRKFARRSAIAALAYGMAGQVIYHLLAAAHVTVAPWPVVVLVSCMPVAVLGLAASLTHMLRAPENDDERGRGAVDASIPRGSPAASPGTVPSSSFEAAKARMRFADEHGFKYSDNEARAQFGLKRSEVTEARRQVTPERSRGGPVGRVPAVPVAQGVPAGENPRSLAGASPNGKVGARG